MNDIVAKDGNVLVKSGEAVGHSLAVTGWADFQKFIKSLRDQGLDITSGKVSVKLGFQARKNDKGQWGTLTFSNPQPLSLQ